MPGKEGRMTSKEYARKFMLEWYWEIPSLTEEELGKLLASEHCGDCTRVASPCLRCQAEQIEADTEDLAKVIDEATADLRANLAEAKDDVKMWKTLYYAEQEARMKAERAREEAQAACEAIDKE